MKRSIAIVIFPNVEELDFVGPWEVFSYLRALEPNACDVFTVSEQGGEVRCAKGLRVLADYSFDTAPKAGIVLVPGGMGTRTEVDNPRLIDYLTRAAAHAKGMADGAFVVAFCDGGYTTNLPFSDVTGGKAWVAFGYDGAPLPPEHGGPARLLVPHLYFWKSAKWVRGLRILRQDAPGFWEQLGYHDRGDPWREQRYQGDP